MASLLVFFLASTTAHCDPGESNPLDSSVEDALKVVIERGTRVPGTAFHLRVNCTDEKGIRGVELYSDGIAIWKNQTQIQVTASTRIELLEALRDKRFYNLADNYGGKQRPERTKVGFKIACEIWLEIGGIQKQSVQQADGEQSARLKSLAATLLDRLEPLVKKGVSARDLEDGLFKLQKNELSAQSFRLRLIELPPNSSSSNGFILRILDGFASRQDYSPGKKAGSQIQESISYCSLEQLTSAILAADMATMPVNLWSDTQIQLEVEVLGHKKSIQARAFSRLKGKAMSIEQQKFDRLMVTLRSFDPHTPVTCKG